MKKFLMIPLLLAAFNAAAQDEETKAAIAKYDHENAIVWDHTEKVTLKFNDGELEAKSEVSRDVLLLTDLAAGVYNTAYAYHSYFHTLGDIEAASMVPKGNGYKAIKTTEFKTTHSEDESIFYDDAKETRVTFGNLTKYGRTHINYTIDHRDIHFLPAFYFQNGTITRSATFEVTVPKGVDLKYIVKGDNQYLIKMTKEESGSKTIYTWTAHDVPKAKSFEDGPEAAYFIPHVLIYIADYKAPHSDEVVKVLSSTDDLYHYYWPFIKNINKKEDDSMNKIVASVTKDAKTDREKAEDIYHWVQDHIRYVAFEDSMGGFIPREAGNICSRRFGDCKDMTSLLVTMCRKAGLNAYFTWIGTRHIPYSYSDVPLPITDNHMICSLKLGDEWLFMDGTDNVIPFGIPPYGIQGKEALIGIDSKTYKILKVPEIDADHNTTIDSTHLILSNHSLTGNVQISYKGYGAWYMAALMQYRNETEREKAMRMLAARGSNKYNQKSFDFKPAGNVGKECSLQSSFVLDDYAKNIDKEYYVNLNLQRTYEDDYADRNDRKVLIQHSYKNRKREVVVLDIPTGYHVSYLPPDKEEQVPGLWNYTIRYKNDGKQVKLVKEYELNTLYITPSQFKDHDKLVEDLRNEYKESVVLTAN